MYRHQWSIELYDVARAQEFVEHWQRVSSILQQYPGALGSHIFEVTDGAPPHFFMNGDWLSKEHRAAMSHDIRHGNSELAQQWRQLPPDNTFGKVVRFAGYEIPILGNLPNSER